MFCLEIGLVRFFQGGEKSVFGEARRRHGGRGV